MWKPEIDVYQTSKFDFKPVCARIMLSTRVTSHVRLITLNTALR